MKQSKSILPGTKKSVLLISVFCLMVLIIPGDTIASKCPNDQYTECRGYKKVNYMVKDVNALDRPYAYVIKKTRFQLIEIIAILSLLGTVLMLGIHGIGRYIAHKRNPYQLEKTRSVFIYNLLIRLGHWFNAISTVVLLITGFWMHYIGPDHLIGSIHNVAGGAFVVFWISFFAYEIASFDYKQFLVDDWELREGILRQALFYVIGIFKQEEHPYHMRFAARLNPLQKVAYFTVMFFLVPLVGFTGIVLLLPDNMGFFVNYIGMENMKYIFIFHLCGAFAMLAYLIGHLYLGTTGDKISQHYKVIVTGYHDEYKQKSKK